MSRIGLGTMSVTIAQTPMPKPEAFNLFKTAIDQGVNHFNAGEFYGLNPKEANLIYLKEFFETYPELRSKVKLSIKGCISFETFEPNCSKEGVNNSINNILKYIDFIDVFECARVDPKVAIEDTISYIKEFVDLGKVGAISLSEASAKTIRRAAAVHPIAFVEIEFSMWARHILQDGVYETCQELGIPLVAYSPLGNGFLAGAYQKYDDVDVMKSTFLPKFSEKEVFEHNMLLANKVKEMATKKGVTPAQFAIAWVLKYKGVIPIPGTTKITRLLENLKSAELPLTDEEFDEINKYLSSFEVQGLRYNKHAEQFLML